MGTQKKMGGDQERMTVGDEVPGVVNAWLEVEALGVVFNCWMLLNPEDPKDRPDDEFLAQAPGTPATRVKTKNNGRSFFIGPMYGYSSMPSSRGWSSPTILRDR